MKSKITQLSAESLGSTLQKVETALRAASRQTKAVVKRTLSQEGLCSESSTGVETTLLQAAKRHNLTLPANFAALMGVVDAEEMETGKSSPETPGLNQAFFLNMKGVSILTVNLSNNKSKAVLLDGSHISIGEFGASDLRSSCNLLEFSVSSK